MRTKLAVTMAATALALLVLASPAAAKGPSGGEIEGEGLNAPISLDSMGEGTPGGGVIIEDVGFFQATFGQVPSGMLDDAPTGDLGPMLTIHWDVPGPEGDVALIEQQLYPYADGGPVVFTPAGQRFFTSEQTVGGWFRAPERLVTTLQELGVPSADELLAAASGGGGDGAGTRWAPIGASLTAVVLLGAGLAVASRRRGEVAAAAG